VEDGRDNVEVGRCERRLSQDRGGGDFGPDEGRGRSRLRHYFATWPADVGTGGEDLVMRMTLVPKRTRAAVAGDHLANEERVLVESTRVGRGGLQPISPCASPSLPLFLQICCSVLTPRAFARPSPHPIRFTLLPGRPLPFALRPVPQQVNDRFQSEKL